MERGQRQRGGSPSLLDVFTEVAQDMTPVEKGDFFAKEVSGPLTREIAIVRGSKPGIEESYSIALPSRDDWGDMGSIVEFTPITRQLRESPDEIAETIKIIRERLASMSTLEAVAATSIRVIAGEEKDYHDLELPIEFAQWTAMGVLAHMSNLEGPITFRDVEALMAEYGSALERRYGCRPGRLWTDLGDRSAEESVAVLANVCFATMVATGMQRG